jgi:hypothetical protein
VALLAHHVSPYLSPSGLPNYEGIPRMGIGSSGMVSYRRVFRRGTSVGGGVSLLHVPANVLNFGISHWGGFTSYDVCAEQRKSIGRSKH